VEEANITLRFGFRCPRGFNLKFSVLSGPVPSEFNSDPGGAAVAPAVI